MASLPPGGRFGPGISVNLDFPIARLCIPALTARSLGRASTSIRHSWRWSEREVVSAECTDLPVRIDEPSAAPTGPPQGGAAIRTEDELVAYGPGTFRTGWNRAKLLGQIGVLDLPLIALFDGLAGSQQQVDDDSRDESKYNDERGEDLNRNVRAAALDVPEGPNGHRKPQRDRKCGSPGESELKSSSE